MTEHTPGPWTASARHYSNDGTQDEMSGLGWEIEGPPEPSLRGQFAKAADAYLIAAAPDLLEALEHLLLDYESEWGSELVDYEYADVRAALAKARGK